MGGVKEVEFAGTGRFFHLTDRMSYSTSNSIGRSSGTSRRFAVVEGGVNTTAKLPLEIIGLTVGRLLPGVNRFITSVAHCFDDGDDDRFGE